MPIRILPQGLANRIAAGEVVERPASVVKELIENALDAGASRISVSVSGGGRSMITVQDDGCGMSFEDLSLCLERHATSKIPDDDLSAISSLGFRGEALPSIGSVSRLKVISRQAESDCAWCIQCDGGAVGQVSPSPGVRGTIVDVRDLFFSTPARLKFLKSEATENAAIRRVIEDAAITRHDVAFQLHIDNRRVISTSASGGRGDRLSMVRLKDIAGAEFAENATPIDHATGGWRVSGWAGLPTYRQRDGKRIWVSANGRPVSDRFLASCVKTAYSGLMDDKSLPACVIDVAVPPSEIDVNVHPSKAEVRFRSESDVRSFVVDGIRRALADAGCRTSTTVASAAIEAAVVSDTIEHLGPGPLGVPLGQAHGNYIMTEAPGGIAIIDQHAAHERIVLERLKREFFSGGVEGRRLPTPLVVDVGHEKAAALSDASEELARYGMEIDGFGGDGSVVVRSVPSVLGSADVTDLVHDLAVKVGEMGGAGAIRGAVEEVCSTLACHNAIRSGDAMTKEEMSALLRDMERTDFSSQCNHGRPTVMFLSFEKLEKMFGR